MRYFAGPKARRRIAFAKTFLKFLSEIRQPSEKIPHALASRALTFCAARKNRIYQETLSHACSLVVLQETRCSHAYSQLWNRLQIPFDFGIELAQHEDDAMTLCAQPC
jgi:hypothetical protein